MDIIYTMPGQPHRMFINIVHACPNACFFCVDFKGDMFYGFDLKNGSGPTADEIVEAVEKYSLKESTLEVYFCGIGEPLLLYDRIMESVPRVRSLFDAQTIMAINTSGTFYTRHRRVDFANLFDLIQVSLNAENEEKYDLICRPKVAGAYQSMMEFLHDLRAHIDRTASRCKVELTIVDPVNVERLPKREHGNPVIPRPDIEACRGIAENLGWPLKVKTLIEDCDHVEWRTFAANFRSQTVRHGTINNC